MAHKVHQVRDAVHTFIQFNEEEARVIDSAPFQRLRHVHQLALTYKVYPGASHKRFEHSMGVMELTGRIFDVITRDDKLSDLGREIVPDKDHLGWWRTVVRLAALCHDMGHLPFSHAAEDELLPDGVDHEQLTWDIVHSDEIQTLFQDMRPPMVADVVGKLAVGPRKAARLKLGVSFDPWEAILAEVIVGDTFGADRMDYLLRDSLHTGVAYGRFDHERLINTLRIIGEPARDESEHEGGGTEAVLGCERGGIQSAEQLLLARYFMFSQVYHHPTRLAYNEHLKSFLKLWLPGGFFPVDVPGHLLRDDTDVLVGIKAAAADSGHPAHDPARRIVFRDHFRSAYERRAAPPGGAGDTSWDVQTLAIAAAQQFGDDKVAYGAPPSRKTPPDFAVRDGGRGGSVWAKGLSDVLVNMPRSPDEYVLADQEIRDDVRAWLNSNRETILQGAREDQIKQAEEA